MKQSNIRLSFFIITIIFMCLFNSLLNFLYAQLIFKLVIMILLYTVLHVVSVFTVICLYCKNVSHVTHVTPGVHTMSVHFFTLKPCTAGTPFYWNPALFIL